VVDEPGWTAHVLAAARTVLGVTAVGTADNFFALGGDSLAAIELTAALEERTGRPLDLDLLFDCETLGEFAAATAPPA
jgi:acyl carrier protein